MKINRLIAFVLVAAMLLPWFVLPESNAHVHAIETEPTLTVGSVEGKPGDTLQIPVTITNNPGFTILNLRVKFDDAAVESAIEVVNSKNNPDGQLPNNIFTKSQKNGSNPVTMYWADGEVDYTEDGVLGFVEVIIKDDAVPGVYDVYISEEHIFEAYNINYEVLNFALVAGTITVVGDECTEHAWSDWTEVTAPGCETTGTKTRTCGVCGQMEEDVIPALGHSYTNYVSNGDAACETDGTETAKCDRCDATDTRTAAGTALGHSFTEYVSDGNATCETDGTETATCDRCDVTDTRTEVGSHEKAEHSFPAEYTSDGNATCTADGTKSRVCTVCGEKETVTDAGSALGHSFTAYVSNGDATCLTDGTETAKCDRCDATDTRTDADSALGHDYSAKTTEHQATVADCAHKATYYYTCAHCGEKGTETFEQGEVDLTNHVGGTELRNEKPATEEEKGYTGDLYCLGCGNVITYGQEIPELGHTHNLKNTDAKEATCEAEGNTAYWTCTKCGKLYADAEATKEITIEETVIAALGHSFTDYVSDGNATCEADGTETAKCDRCDATDTRTVAGSALGHSFTNYVSNGDATCEADGTETAKCDRCDATDTRTDAGSKLDHQYTAKTTDHQATAADCCHKATYYYTCAHCGKQGTETFEAGEYDMTNHVGGTEVRGAVAPTEETEGYTGDTYCLGCETVIAEGEVIPTLDHTHTLVKTEGKDATCETAGTAEHWTCTKCGKLFSDAEGTKEITAEDAVIAAPGHSYTNYVSNGDATCETDGTETAKCDNCDATDTRTAVGSALGHAWSEWTVATAATCTENGEEKRTCGNCGKTETNVLTALGHEYGEYVSNGDATCEADGTETAKCVRCDVTDTRTEEGSALGHAWSEWTVTTPATCTENGAEERVCGNCGKTETNVLEALGHDFGEWTVVKEATCTEAGEQTRTCAVCDATETQEIAALGHDYKSVVTEPTETEKGYTTHTCATCGDSYVDSYVDPKPETPDKQPQTGDNAQIVLWTVLVMASIAGAGVLMADRKKWMA